MTVPWFRFSIDLSHDGEWVGASYEVRQDDHLVGLKVLPRPGPFDEPWDLIRDMIEEVEDAYGIQLKLL